MIANFLRYYVILKTYFIISFIKITEGNYNYTFPVPNSIEIILKTKSVK